MGIAVAFAHVIHMASRGIEKVPLVQCFDDARPEPAIDRMFGHQILHQPLGFLGQLPEAVPMFRAEALFQLFCGAPLAGAHLPAIAARGAEGDVLGFEQHCVIAALGEVECRREAGIAATDDRHIGATVALEPWAFAAIPGGRLVPASYGRHGELTSSCGCRSHGPRQR